MDIKYEIKSFIILLFIWHFVQIYDTVHLKKIKAKTLFALLPILQQF